MSGNYSATSVVLLRSLKKELKNPRRGHLWSSFTRKAGKIDKYRIPKESPTRQN
jgi:hypothetical protein